MEGEDVFANCDYDLMKEYLERFLLGWHRSPHNTSGTFVCPVWMWKVFWKLLGGAVLLLYQSEGEFFYHESGMAFGSCGETSVRARRARSDEVAVGGGSLSSFYGSQDPRRRRARS
jgi:hypothetical protein